MRDVCDYYKRYHRHGWDRVLIEIGIRPGSTCYKPFMTGFIIIVTVGMNIIARIVIITINTIISIIKNINTTNIINIYKHHKWHDGYDDDDWDDDDD